jgi:hypothetical protein
MMVLFLLVSVCDSANGLDSRSEIGIYTADGTIYSNHGESGDPFGTVAGNRKRNGLG